MKLTLGNGQKGIREGDTTGTHAKIPLQTIAIGIASNYLCSCGTCSRFDFPVESIRLAEAQSCGSVRVRRSILLLLFP